MDDTFVAPQINTVAFDCHDPERLAEFWTQLLDVEIRHEEAQFIWLGRQRAGGVSLMFQQVPDPTPGKNKLHLDGYHQDLEALTARVTELGGTFVTRQATPHFVWNIYADPEGNQFCCGHELEAEA